MKVERKSRILVSVLDGIKLGELVLTQGHVAAGLPQGAKLKVDGSYAYVKTANGIMFLDSEGTGGSDSVEKPPVEIFFTRADINACGPCLRCDYGAEELLTLPVSGKVNLAVFIRQFGARLESNFRAWNKFLEESVPTAEYIQS